MKTVAAKLYEGLFLVDSALAASDWDGINETIKAILERAEAQIVSIRKWDERKLAYEIEGKSRGTYILAFFRVDGAKVRDIERAAQLSERIMRVLILNAEGREQENIDKETPAIAAAREAGKTSAAESETSGPEPADDEQTEPSQPEASDESAAQQGSAESDSGKQQAAEKTIESEQKQ